MSGRAEALDLLGRAREFAEGAGPHLADDVPELVAEAADLVASLDAVLLEEPSEAPARSPASESLRRILLDPAHADMSPEAEALLRAAVASEQSATSADRWLLLSEARPADGKYLVLWSEVHGGPLGALAPIAPGVFQVHGVQWWRPCEPPPHRGIDPTEQHTPPRGDAP